MIQVAFLVFRLWAFMLNKEPHPKFKTLVFLILNSCTLYPFQCGRSSGLGL
jgi:hypothetical protein